MTDSTPPPTKEHYADDDLVYVDPDKRVVVGLVQWSNTGRPKSLEIPQDTEKSVDPKTGKPRRARRKRSYPWGTYRSMKRLFKIEGKVHDDRPMLQLDEAIALCQNEPFWDIEKESTEPAGPVNESTDA